ncbi:helix-turn-helix transcriptional regulator [Nigerium massiliense]|uniref:helix-turn-helix transcriptional regulator n=1 Tax=Nigerium massiliense TaxID=1522317 RepID=UPI00164E294A
MNPVAEAPSEDASTRDRVALSVLEHGPSTAAELADRLSLTAAAVRRHLSVLVEVGHLVSREKRVYGQRGRGRPAKVFALTDAGRAEFYQAYDKLAIQSLSFLADSLGEGAISEFAESVMSTIETRFDPSPEYDTAADALVAVLTRQGFVASLRPMPAGRQLCQYHCPFAHVAREFPELCAAETRIFSRVLGSHVQRLATIAHGDGVCTTFIPHTLQQEGQK